MGLKLESQQHVPSSITTKAGDVPSTRGRKGVLKLFLSNCGIFIFLRPLVPDLYAARRTIRNENSIFRVAS